VSAEGQEQRRQARVREERRTEAVGSEGSGCSPEHRRLGEERAHARFCEQHPCHA